MKYVYIACGILCVILGSIGIFLPILPTTPFLLLALFLFTKSSDQLHSWLLNHKVLGKFIYNYTVHKAITKRAKISAIIMLWLTLTLSMFIVDITIVTLILIAVGSGVTWHLLSFKTLK